MINTELINKSLIPIFLFFLLLLILVPFFGAEVKGAKRWLNIYIFRFQPIEFIKPFFILVIAQIIASNKIKNLSSVIYTHEHADQTSGLFELRPFFLKHKKKINIYGNLRTINHLKKRFDYCFESFYGYPAIVKGNIIKKVFSLGKHNEKINFNTTQVVHGPIKATAYVFENTAYISDCNDLSIVNMKIFQNLKHLVIDCLRIKKSPVHFNLEEALYVHTCLKPKRTILTNLNSELNYDFLLKRLPKNVLPAYDGLKLNL